MGRGWCRGGAGVGGGGGDGEGILKEYKNIIFCLLYGSQQGHVLAIV